MFGKKQSKFLWKLNLFIGLLLILVLYVGVNGIAFKHYFRKNVLIAASYTQVNNQTKNLLKSLSEPLTIINYVSTSADPVTPLIAGDVDSLLDEYAYYGRKSKGKVIIKRVDPYINFEEAKKIADEFKLTTQENVLILQYRGQNKIISYAELANVDTSQMDMGGAPRLQSFKAEDALTSAIQSLSQGKKTKIYFLTGHGEYDPESSDADNLGYSILKSYLERQNSVVEKLNLVEKPEIPADADLIICACPKNKYNSYEIDVLQAYLQQEGAKGGRLVLMLDPGIETGLENFTEDYGVTFQNDLVMAKFATLGQTKVVANAIVSIYPDHPAVEWIRKQNMSLNLGPVRSLAISNAKDKNKSATVTALAKTAPVFWGEMDLKAVNPDFDAAKDAAGPLNIVVSIDTASVSGGQVQLKGVKIILIGGGQFLINQVISADQVDFFVNVTNWMLEEGKPLGITPKTPKEFTVTMSSKQMTSLVSILLLFPLAGLVVATVLWFKRRA